MAKKQATVSEAEIAELRRMAAVANSRIARATPGQRRELEHWTHGRNFSRAIPKTRAEYNVRMAALQRFINAESTTRKGWESIKKKAVAKATGKMGKLGYDLTDDELADILEELRGHDKKDLYRILDIVQAIKWESEEKFANSGDIDDRFHRYDAIEEALAEKSTAAEAISRKMAARKKVRP